jgi:hypothetical protein
MGSFTITNVVTFTATHARHLASKVSADLKRMQRFYSQPTDTRIADYETELIELLKEGYLDTLTLGFKRDGNWIEPTLRYKARDLNGMQSGDDDPGKIRPSADVSGASFYSYATYTAKWDTLSSTEQDAFKKRMPFYRGGADEPGVSGYLESDRTYSSGGKALNRSAVRSY